MVERKSATDIPRRRRAIYMGLKQYLEGDDLLNALCIWQQHYSRLPKFAITNFVRRITENTGLASSRAAIHLSLTSSLMLNEDSLGPDPLADMRHYLGSRLGDSEAESILGGSTNAPDDGARRSDNIQVFEILMNSFFTGISDSQQTAVADVRSALLRRLPELIRDPNQLQAISDWLRDGKRTLQAELDAGQLQQLLHAAYVVACDRLGPVRTDQCLTRALDTAERSDAGRRQSPRMWL
ncbi:hypothetical protein J2T55_000513 [Methylohalomonas lacus]|uniref:Uncharacterized protein n=1 Tax=Methylohalomonas lacus TaxID=398773 RepID=A0AAE3HHR7_9GAMM|nr:hypothetical protein [Methylohalomonas lacus]MCS3902509.1 hypothetical protein [Methylohalomonas lacus]